MKKRLLTVSFLLIAVFLLMASAFAAGSINDLQTTVSNVTASLNGTDKIDVTCTNLTAGDEYLIMVLEGSQIPDSSNIVYMDQKTANRSSLTFTVNPMRLDEGDYYIAMSSTDSDLAIVGSFSVRTPESTPYKIIILPHPAPFYPGETITIIIEAEGEGLTYQWYLKNLGQATFSKSSVTTNTYTVKMSAANNGRKIYCVITDKYGNRVTTDVIPLSMITGPTITKQPKSVSVPSGQTASVTVEATGEGLKYQWYLKNANQSSFSKSSVTTSTYSVKMSANSNGRQVYCVVTDTNGAEVTSDVATLSIGSELKITKHPTDVTVPSGQTASVTVEAEGDGLNYQWYIKNAGQAVFSKSSVTTNTYTVKMSANSNGRQIYCVVTDNNGAELTSDTATLSIGTELKITKQPSDVTVPSGQTASVTVEAEGDGLNYQWYIKNAGQAVFSKSSVATNTYTVKMSANSNGRQIYCVVTDKNGNEATTDTVTLSMSAELKITKQPSDVIVPSGQTASVTVEADGNGLKYQWYIKNAGQAVFSKSSVTTNTYTVKMSATSKGRQLYCEVSDQYGRTVITDTVTLSMSAELKITKQPSDVTVPSVQTASVSVEAQGDGLKYQWYIKNAGQTVFSKSSVTTNTYTVKMSATSKGRQLYCVVSDKYGRTVTTDTVTLSMSAELKITTQPANVTTSAGKTVAVTVEAQGDGLKYQWYIKNVSQTGFAKSSVASNTYTVKMSANSDGRQLYCEVTDQYGKIVKSNVVTLHIG